MGVVPPQSARGAHRAGPTLAAAKRKSAAGRKPSDEVLIFKALVVQALYNLSDEQAEYQLRDRLSSLRFLGLGLEDAVPDAATLWLYREALAGASAVEELFAAFDGYLRERGLLAMRGQIVEATIVAAPRQRNSRDENAAIKRGQTPAGCKKHPAKASQKDVDARRTKIHGRIYYDYKNDISMDQCHKLVLRYSVTDAARHESTELDAVLDPDNTYSEVWADSAYRSAEIEEKLVKRGLKSRIHRSGTRKHPLSAREQQGNVSRSRVRAPVEHVFDHQANAMGGKFVRTIGLARARAKIGMQNLTYNMSRLVYLLAMAASPR